MISKQDLLAIANTDHKSGISSLLPAAALIPDDFKYPNLYTQAVEGAIGLRTKPEARLVLRPGYEGVETLCGLQKFIQHQLREDQRDVESIRAVAYVVSNICEITAIK